MLAAAVKFYQKAAEMYPPDDEFFPCTVSSPRLLRIGTCGEQKLTQERAADFMKVAFEAEWHRGRPLSETLPLCERIWKALPGVFKIWEGYSSLPLKEQMRQVDQWAARAYTGLLEEKYTMQTPSVSVPISNYQLYSPCYLYAYHTVRYPLHRLMLLSVEASHDYRCDPAAQGPALIRC